MRSNINYLSIIPIGLLLLSLLFKKRIGEKGDRIVRIVSALFILLMLILNIFYGANC